MHWDAGAMAQDVLERNIFGDLRIWQYKVFWQ
jgi:hypothetical protein